VLGCNNGIGGFCKNLVTFRESKLLDFWLAQKMRLKKFTSLVQLKRWQVWLRVSKMQNGGNSPQDRHQPKICLIPNILAYCNRPWTGANVSMWLYRWNIPGKGSCLSNNPPRKADFDFFLRNNYFLDLIHIPTDCFSFEKFSPPPALLHPNIHINTRTYNTCCLFWTQKNPEGDMCVSMCALMNM